jgi:hypothetical protein
MTYYLRALMARLRGLFGIGIRKADLEFDDEIQAHLFLNISRMLICDAYQNACPVYALPYQAIVQLY